MIEQREKDIRLVYAVTYLEQRTKFFNRQTSLANDTAQGAFCQLGVMRDGESTMRRMRLAQDDMTAGLVIHQIAKLLQCTDSVLPGHHRQFTHRAMSTVSSQIDGGIGSLWSLKLSR